MSPYNGTPEPQKKILWNLSRATELVKTSTFMYIFSGTTKQRKVLLSRNLRKLKDLKYIKSPAIGWWMITKTGRTFTKDLN